jgi:hypothetical protein
LLKILSLLSIYFFVLTQKSNQKSQGQKNGSALLSGQRTFSVSGGGVIMKRLGLVGRILKTPLLIIQSLRRRCVPPGNSLKKIMNLTTAEQGAETVFISEKKRLALQMAEPELLFPFSLIKKFIPDNILI